MKNILAVILFSTILNPVSNNQRSGDSGVALNLSL